MFLSSPRKALPIVLILFVLNGRAADASQPNRVLPDGNIVPGESCGFGVTTQSERAEIILHWLVFPGLASAMSFVVAILIRNRLPQIDNLRRRTLGAVSSGVLGAVALMLGLYVLLVGSMHMFDVISLYEPLF